MQSILGILGGSRYHGLNLYLSCWWSLVE